LLEQDLLDQDLLDQDLLQQEARIGLNHPGETILTKQ
jgi:hypothetical protein